MKDFFTKFKDIFALPKWAKIFLALLSALVLIALGFAFTLQIYAKDRIFSASLSFHELEVWKTQKELSQDFSLNSHANSTNLDAFENTAQISPQNPAKNEISSDQKLKFSYKVKINFNALKPFLRSKTISRTEILDIKWDKIDKAQILSTKAENRYISFITTQNLEGTKVGEILGQGEFKADFSPFYKTIFDYYLLFLILFFLVFIVKNSLQICVQNEKSKAKLLFLISPNFMQKTSFHLAFSFLIFIILLFTFSTLGFLVKIPINSSYFYLALAFSIFALFYKNEHKIQSAIIYFVLFCTALILSLNFYDASFDGRSYHQASIFYLAHGWNPVYYDLAAANKNFPFLQHEIWTEHYLRFGETIQACIYKAFGMIEAGKIINYFFAFGAFFYAVSVLLNFKIHKFLAIFLAFLIAFSPVVLVQISTFYIDGLLACALVCLFLAILDLEISPNKAKYAIFTISLLATASIKFTGIAYAGFIGVFYLFYKMLFFKQGKGIFVSGVVAGLFIVILNASPLITNQIQHGHFAYPLMGENKIDIITYQSPRDFNGLNRFEKLGKSLFSKTANFVSTAERESELKIPFSVSGGDEKADVDTRVAGFGWFFGGILLLSILLVVLNFKAFLNKKFAFMFFIILISILINPECWWARYAPQIWLLPLVILIYSFIKIKSKSAKILQILILFFLCLNFLSLPNILRPHYTKTTKNELKDLKFSTDEILIYLPYGFEGSIVAKLNERNYKAKIISKDEFLNLKAKGVKFYILDNVLDNLEGQNAFWNVKPKGF